MPVEFFEEEIDFTPSNPDRLRQWIEKVIRDYGSTTGELNYIFCTDAYLLEINREYLQHDYYTDIITFDQSEKPGEVSGDLYISVERVRDHAQNQYHVPFEDELHRVMIHGVLHLLGLGDKTPQEEAAMRAAEEKALAQRGG